MSRFWTAALALLLLTAMGAAGQWKKQEPEDRTRSVQGVVTSPDDKPEVGAVVFLKNTKSLQVRSFITKDGGTYSFQGLNPDIDYELRAESKGLASSAKTLSSFDSRKQAVVNLKLNKK